MGKGKYADERVPMRTWARWVAVGLAVAGVIWAIQVSRWQAGTGLTSGSEPGVSERPSHTTGEAVHRAEHLRRGINLSWWYAQTGDYSDERMNGYMTVDDMRTLRRLGFDHVRLCIDPEPLIANSPGGAPRTEAIALQPKAVARLDKTVGDLTGAGLNVVLDIQPEARWKAPLAKGDESAENFIAFWIAFAAHYAQTDPERVFFEVLNEPAIDDLYRWEGIQAGAVARIRSVAPRHTLIATASHYSSIDGLLKLQPVRDNNVIYTFHEYDPMWFTQQGVTWGDKGWASLRRVPYPATARDIKAVEAQEPDEREREKIEHFGAERWNASGIAAEVKAVDEWADKQGVPVYCGEFGVYKDYSDPKARVSWIADVRTALESRHIGWAMWDYDGNFGLMTDDRPNKTVDPDVLHALGLGK